MSYLGRGLDNISNVEKLDNITFNGGTTYALTKSSAAFTPAGANNILISIDGVVQQGNFSISGSNIVFTFSPTSSNTCDFIMHYGTGLISTPADSSVTASKIDSNAVTTAKIQNDAVTVDKVNLISTSSVPSLEAKGTSGQTEGYIQLNCAENSHGIKLKSPPHSASQSYTLTFPSTSPSADKFIKTDGSGNLSFAEAGGGALELIARSVNDDSGTSGGIDFNGCFTSTYRNYLLLIGKIAVETNQADLQVRLKDTSNNSLTGGHYTRAGQNNDAGNNATGTNQAIGTSSWIIGPSSHNADSTPTHGSFFIFNNSHTTTNDRIFMTGTGLWHHEAQHDPRMFYFGGSYANAVHASGLRIETSSGNVSDHEISIYGIKAY